MRLLFFFLILLHSHIGALGNTEIINFPVHQEPTVWLPFTTTWPTLSPESSTLMMNVSSAPLGTVLPQSICANLDRWHPVENVETCPHELWVVLELDQDTWRAYDKFTLRISWAAFNPTDISMEIFDHASLSAYSKGDAAASTQKTRRKYARIQLVHTGVLTPGVTTPMDQELRYNMPIFLILEPLQFGVLPTSVVPVIIAILIVVVLGWPVSKKISTYLQTIVRDARIEEVAGRKGN
ncbi:hypothetical protein B0H34DRAFT_8845 [Crassisporium funariophilum]|nr:hypothetical protein B0H34DRAFT_8845 [Crassisporium funariophilum]